MSTPNVESKEPHHQHGSMVQVTIDSNPRQIQDGVYKVSKLKVLLGVAPDHVLNEVAKDGNFKELPDERSFHVKGDEVFVSQLPQGSSA